MQIKTAVYAFAALLVVSSTIAVVMGDPDGHKGTKMAEALKMLQSLDKYYGQVARPRYGKRGDYRRLDEDRLGEILNEEMLEEPMWNPLR